MNYVGTFEWIRQLAIKPIVLKLVCVVLVVLIGWEIISDIGLLSQLNQQVQSNTKHFHGKPADLGEASITKHPLFGEYVPSNLDAAGVRQSMLNLKVVGIVFAENENDSLAILQRENGQEHFFRVGDELLGGGVIKRITVEGVLILRDGELERLSLPKDELNFEAPAQPMSVGNERSGF